MLKDVRSGLLAVLLIPLAFLVLLPIEPAFGEASSTIGFSGNLLDSSGSPLDGTVSITFELYDASSGGNRLWTETDNVICEDGFCPTTLGDGTSFDTIFTDNADVYLQVIVEESTMSPRTSLSSCSYSQHARTAESLSSGAVTTASITDSAVTTAKVNDSAITSAKISDGTIAAADLASDSVTTAKIADSGVTTAKIADSGVTTAKITDGTIAAVDLASDSVTSAKVADGAIAAADVADDTLDFSQLKDNPTLDNSLNLSQGTNTWTQTYSGTSGLAFGFGCTGAVTTSACTTFDLDNTSATVAAVSISNKGSGVSFRVNDDGTHTDTTPFMVDASGNVGIRTNSPLSGLHIGAGGLSVHRVAASSAYTASCSDFIIGVIAVPLTVTLPAASTCGAGKILLIKDETITANTTTQILTIARSGSDLIDGATTKTLTTGGAAALLYSDGSLNWFGF